MLEHGLHSSAVCTLQVHVPIPRLLLVIQTLAVTSSYLSAGTPLLDAVVRVRG
jgi:hypothetical protein